MQRQTTRFVGRRTFPAALALLAVLGWLTGCKGKPVPTLRAFEGVRLRVACPAGPVASIVATAGQVWSRQSGAGVEVIAPDAGRADLRVIAPAELAHEAAAGRVRPVPAEFLQPENRYAWLDLLPVYRNKLLTWAGKVYALPLCGDATLCYYRDDWLRDPARQADFEAKYGRRPAPPATWDEYADLAEFFAGQSADGAAPADSAEDLDREFYSRAASLARRAAREDDPKPPPDDELFSFHYDLATGAPRIDRPGFAEALRQMQRLGAARRPAGAFRDGRAGVCLAGTACLGCFQQDGSPVRGRFAVCRVPGSRRVYNFQTGELVPLTEVNHVPYLGAGGWLGAVPTNAAQPDAAFAFLAELSGPQMSAETVLGASCSGGAFRSQHLALMSRANAFELDSRRTQTLVEALRATLAPPISNPVVRLRTPDDAEHFRAMADAIRAALANPDRDPQAILDEVAQRWRQFDARKNPAERLADYRLSLGLPPGR
jgi:multiple sugar transport system substrate-binding protein